MVTRCWAEHNILAILRLVEKSWQPQDFLSNASSSSSSSSSSEEGFLDRIRDIRKRAREIPNENYVPSGEHDQRGCAIDLLEGVQHVRWGMGRDRLKPHVMGGGQEENHHEDLINKHLYLCGRVDMRQAEKTIQYLIDAGMKIAEAAKDKEKDVDYLSSIEVLIIDHADVISMQNWAHVNTVVEQLNQTPSKPHRTDIMRVRQWYLDGHARFYRQTILLSSFLNPDLNALFNRLCVNYEGKVKLVCDHKGVLPKVLLPVRQVYERFGANSIVDVDDARFDYFVKKMFPKIKDSIQGGIMLFINSFLEFVRIRNFLKSQNASFCLLGEYTKPSDISRARVWFFQEKRKIMLYTERAHFYHRYKIRGIQNLIIYSLPERKDFYPEMLNRLDGSKNMMCNVLFSRFDFLRLERIVGTAAAKRMLSSEKDTFVFC